MEAVHTAGNHPNPNPRRGTHGWEQQLSAERRRRQPPLMRKPGRNPRQQTTQRKKPMAAKVFDTKGVDSREKARFHVNMIVGTRHVTIVDTKYKPLTRAMKLDVSPMTISEA